MTLLITLVICLGPCIGLIIMIARSASRAEEEERRLRGAVPDGPQGELGPYELAYLAGGPERVAETAIAAVVRDGRIRATRDGRLHRVAGAGLSEVAVERAVVNALEERGGESRAANVRSHVCWGLQVEAVRTRLVEMGLLLSDADDTRLRGFIGKVTSWGIAALLTAAVFLIAFPFVWWVLPTGGTVVLLASIVALLMIGAWGGRRSRRLEVRLGDELTEPGRHRLASAFTAVGVLAYPHTVALQGPSAIEENGLGDALENPRDGFGGGDFGSGGGGDFDTAGAGCGGGCGGCGGG